MDRRSTRRYDLKLPITIYKNPPHIAQTLTGFTRDVSTRGIYFTINHTLSPGWEFDFATKIPTELTQGKVVSIRAHGRVMRAEKGKGDDNDRVGIAAIIENYEFVLAEPD